MKQKSLVVNGIVAALYVVLTMVVNPVSFLANQFRLPEMLNHLVVFNKKYFWGIITGVFIANLLFSPLLPLDLIFGVLHTGLSLIIAIILRKFIKNDIIRMVVNTLVFSFLMCIIAFEITVIIGEDPFIITWGALFLSELFVMGVGIPVMHTINKRLNFSKQIETNH